MRKYLLIYQLLVLATVATAQNDLTFYHLGSAAPQAQSFNASFFPQAKMYLSLPVLSGVSLNVNSGLSYNEIFTKIPETDSVRIDVEKMLRSLKGGDRLRVDGTISLFQFGHSIGKNAAITAFVNDRFHMSAYYPTNVLRYLVEGGGSIDSESLREDYLSASTIYFREMGLGYIQKLNVGGKNLSIGVRAKYLQGVFQSQTNPNASVTMQTENIGFAFEHAEVQTAGTSIASLESHDYLISNKNVGYGVDLGMQLDISDKLTLSTAINDIGQITWTEDVKNYRLINDTISYPEMDLTELDNFAEVLTDTLEQMLSQEEYTDSYKSNLPYRALASMRYKVTNKGTVNASFLYESGVKDDLMKYALGYTHQFGRSLILSATASYDEVNQVDLGAGMVVYLGTFQFYTSVDSFGNLFESTHVGDVNKVNFRVGLNFVFGRPGKREKKEKNKVQPFPDEYDLDHLHEIGSND